MRGYMREPSLPESIIVGSLLIWAIVSMPIVYLLTTNQDAMYFDAIEDVTCVRDYNTLTTTCTTSLGYDFEVTLYQMNFPEPPAWGSRELLCGTEYEPTTP